MTTNWALMIVLRLEHNAYANSTMSEQEPCPILLLINIHFMPQMGIDIFRMRFWQVCACAMIVVRSVINNVRKPFIPWKSSSEHLLPKNEALPNHLALTLTFLVRRWTSNCIICKMSRWVSLNGIIFTVMRLLKCHFNNPTVNYSRLTFCFKT